MKGITIILAIVLVSAVTCDSFLMSLTKDFFAGYNPESKLSASCVNGNWETSVDDTSSNGNNIDELLNSIFIDQIGTGIHEECGWNSVVHDLNAIHDTKSNKDILNILLASKSAEQNFRNLYKSFNKGSFNATALGAILRELTDPVSHDTENTYSDKLRLFDLHDSLEHSDYFSLLQNVTYFAYGVTLGLSSNGYIPSCANDSIGVYNDVLLLIAYWRTAWDNPEYLPDLTEQMIFIEEETLALYNECDIPELDIVLKKLDTKAGDEELVDNIIMNLDQISNDVNTIRGTDDPIVMGQAVGNIIKITTGFSLQ